MKRMIANNVLYNDFFKILIDFIYVLEYNEKGYIGPTPIEKIKIILTRGIEM